MGGGNEQQGSRQFFAPAKVDNSTRVWLPPAGGQTITPPVAMGDASMLWGPITGQERSKAKVLPRYARFEGSNTAIQWLPSTERETMQDYLYRLLEGRRGITNKSLQRAAAHMPIVLEGVKAQNLPVELACLPLVESAFEPGAVSRAGAGGLWQLMPATARRYGLTVDSQVDERFDVPRATMAATAYLAYLYQCFGDWPLALAAYNCGEGNVQKAVEFTGATTLEGIMRWMAEDPSRPRVLPEETRNFVPAFTAAVVVMSQSDSLGLTAAPLIHLPYAKDTYAPRFAEQRAASRPGGNKEHPGTAAPSGQTPGGVTPPPAPVLARPEAQPSAVPQPAAPPALPKSSAAPVARPEDSAPNGRVVAPAQAAPVLQPPLRSGNAPLPPSAPPPAAKAPETLPAAGGKGAAVPPVEQTPRQPVAGQPFVPPPAQPPVQTPVQTPPVHVQRNYDSNVVQQGGAVRKREEQFILHPGQHSSSRPEKAPLPPMKTTFEDMPDNRGFSSPQQPLPPTGQVPQASGSAAPLAAPAVVPAPVPPPRATGVPPEDQEPVRYSSPFPKPAGQKEKSTPKVQGSLKQDSEEPAAPPKSNRVK